MVAARHVYDYDVNESSDSAPAHVIRLVGQHKTVLELGCGPGSITRVLTGRQGCRVVALERDPDAIAYAAPHCSAIFEADLNLPGWHHFLKADESFDVVVAADVLEHLYDPWSVLKSMASLINRAGYLVVSLPHAGHAAVAGCLVHGDFSYRDWGLLDRTHLRFFCLKNMEMLFHGAGLSLIEVHYVTRAPEETEFASIWRTLPRPVQQMLRSSPHSDIYQVVVKAVPHERAVHPVSLTLSRSDPRPPVARARWTTRIGARMDAKTKRRIRAAMNTVGLRI